MSSTQHVASLNFIGRRQKCPQIATHSDFGDAANKKFLSETLLSSLILPFSATVEIFVAATERFLRTRISSNFRFCVLFAGPTHRMSKCVRRFTSHARQASRELSEMGSCLPVYGKQNTQRRQQQMNRFSILADAHVNLLWKFRRDTRTRLPSQKLNFLS